MQDKQEIAGKAGKPLSVLSVAGKTIAAFTATRSPESRGHNHEWAHPRISVHMEKHLTKIYSFTIKTR